MKDKIAIASFLKQLRKTSGKKSKDVVTELEAYNINISEKTLNGYENGVSMPNADVFMMLCAIYHCDNPMELLFSDFGSEISRDLLFKFNALDKHGEKIVLMLLNEEYERCQRSKDSIRVYTYYRHIACAGEGFIFDDIPSETIEAEELEGADFVIGVNGDSMEPEYHDGDDVYVKRTTDLQVGDVGIFTLNNECFIKLVGEDRLASLNPEYPDIPGSPDIRPIGKVLGKVEK